ASQVEKNQQRGSHFRFLPISHFWDFCFLLSVFEGSPPMQVKAKRGKLRLIKPIFRSAKKRRANIEKHFARFRISAFCFLFSAMPSYAQLRRVIPTITDK